MKGYFTVEAACVLPMVLGLYVFIIYVMFYQYDRCLAEQDVVISAIEGIEGVSEHSEGYLAWEWEERRMQIQNGETKVYLCGKIQVPFAELIRWVGGSEWKVETSFTRKDVDPVVWIRMFKKILKEN